MQKNSRHALVGTSLLILAIACSSGLGSPAAASAAAVTPPNPNLSVGFDPGLQPSAPLTDLALAGVVVPAIGKIPARELALLAFATSSRADDGDGQGRPLSRDPVLDDNDDDDVFVAVVSAADITGDAFCQRLAGKFRHPRCITCHSIAAADTTAFVSSPLPHPIHSPGSGMPTNDPASCTNCHASSTRLPVPGWMAPRPELDLREKTNAELALLAAALVPGESAPSRCDRRIRWAMDSGVLPVHGGHNGAADDDHDGVFDPADIDGRPRTVQGGSAAFRADITAWQDAGGQIDNAGAVLDLTLVSRTQQGDRAGNGASRRPRLHWSPNSLFDPSSPTTAAASNPIGWLYVVYESTADDLVAGDTNQASDIIRAEVELRAEEDAQGNPSPGGLNLRVRSTANLLVSAIDGGSVSGNAASTNAAIGGEHGELIVFESLATDLVAGFLDGNGSAAADIYLRQLNNNSTQLLSHTHSNLVQGGNAASRQPAIDQSGNLVAFATMADDLFDNDNNSAQDIVYAAINNGAPFGWRNASIGEDGAAGSGGDCSVPSVQQDRQGLALIAYQSDKQDLGAQQPNPGVYLFAEAQQRSFACNTRRTAGMAQPVVGTGAASVPQLAADGSMVCFVSAARNIDVLRADDNRHADVFLLGVESLLAGQALPHRISIGGLHGHSADGPSAAPVFALLPGSTAFPVGCVVHATQARNIGSADSTPLLVHFLRETAGVQPDFVASTLRGAVPLLVEFTDRSTGAPTAWEWDFDNNGRTDSRQQNPSHTYRSPGTYTVSLTASNRASTATRSVPALIRVLGRPTASFTAVPTIGAAPLTVQFTDTSTEEPFEWEWDFDGDGIADSTLQHPEHIYTKPGRYSVSLLVRNEAGIGTVTRSQWIEVVQPVRANFSANPRIGIAPLQVAFSDETTGAANSWSWDFDNDGIPDATVQNPIHTYTVPGIYSVRLTAAGPGGNDSLLETDYIVVGGPVTADFTASATREYTTSSIQFTDASTGPITSWSWDFDNDGVIDSTLRNPSHMFTTPGVYSVRLTISGPGGTDSMLKNNFFTAVAASLPLTLQAQQDTSIYSESPSHGNGGNPQLISGNATAAGGVQIGIRRALLAFDVAGSLPPGAVILDASLQLSQNAAAIDPNGPQDFRLHALTSSWGEAATLGNIATGTQATAGDATWVEAVAGAAQWLNAGGDFVLAPRASTTVDGPGIYLWSHPDLALDVQNWLDTPANNHGWLLRGSETSGVSSSKTFGAREAPVAADRPQLLLNYRPPL